MYQRAVRLRLPGYIFIIARRVRELLMSYEYLMNFKSTLEKLQTFVWNFSELVLYYYRHEKPCLMADIPVRLQKRGGL